MTSEYLKVFKHHFILLANYAMEPSPCTPSPKEPFQRDQECDLEAILVWWISTVQNKTKQNKTNKKPCFIDRFQH
jgi:hypothetical protein